MQFDKTKVYTALNADESLIGAKGYFADDIETLKYKVCNTESIQHYKEAFCERLVSNIDDSYNFFYLVEPAPEKYWVKESNGKLSVIDKSSWEVLPDNLIKFNDSLDECKQYITEHSKPKYRPFKDCDELIETYYKKLNHKIDTKLELPTIWVKHKSIYTKHLIIDFGDNFCSVSHPARNEIRGLTLEELFDNYTFLDGSICGVEE